MNSRRTFHRRGLGRTEVSVIIAVLLLVCCAGAILVPGLVKMRVNSLVIHESFVLTEIHQAWVVLGSEYDGAVPTPGAFLASQALDDESGAHEITEDYSLNTSANFYSMLVMQNYVSPDQLISPLDANRIVRAKYDYDWDMYDPAGGVLWDDTFTMQLEDPAVGANASYAHIAWVGDRRKRWESNEYHSQLPVLGTRGPRGGATEGPEYDQSPTLRLMYPKTEWNGQIMLGHGGTTYLKSPTLEDSPFDDGSGIARPDNIFAAEFSHENGNQAAGDAFIGIFTEAGEFTLKDVYDLLD